jgi:integrase
VHALARAAAAPDIPSKHCRIAERYTDQYRLIVLFLAYTGVRFGEMAALCVGRTAVSLAIASDADVKVVQRMLRHKSATMTLDQYGHLFDDRLKDVVDRLDAAARAADVYPSCTRSEIVDLDDKRQNFARP